MDARADHGSGVRHLVRGAVHGIAFYWRIEQAANGVPLIYTYILDPATGSYRTGDMFTGVVDVAAPFPVEIDLGNV
ncbi:hypothetical protein [Nocardia salmonicida]|uniref:hypothetical protein n=1 Tax=Nocardia salmonicida TaxID=53431 RepID=UPI00379659ED